MSLASIQSLIKRYQAKDIILFDILDGLLKEIQALQGVEDTGIFGSPKQIENSVAGDFTIVGDVWNVIGVATFISRVYSLSADGQMMHYSWRIDGGTTGAGLGNELRLKLPAGYVGLASRVAGHVYSGSGNIVIGAGLEAAIVSLVDNSAPDTVRIFRPGLANYPAGAFNTRGTIILPVQKQGIV